MRSLPLKLLPGSDLRLSLEQVGRDYESSGFVLGVVGNLSRAAFQCPGSPQPTVLEGNLEIITLNGTFSPEAVHLHLSLSDGDCQVWGGHLEPGTIILKGADILIGFLEPENPLKYPSNNPKSSSKTRIEIATISDCPWSKRALRLLESSDLNYKIISVDSDSSFEKIKKRSGHRTFPQIFIDGEFVGGYEELSELKASRKLENL